MELYFDSDFEVVTKLVPCALVNIVVKYGNHRRWLTGLYRTAKVRSDLVNFPNFRKESFMRVGSVSRILRCIAHTMVLKNGSLLICSIEGCHLIDQRQRVDTFGGGTIASKSPNEAWQTCEELAENSLQ